MKIEVIRAFCIGGERQEPGTALEVPALLASELIHNGKAIKAPAPAEKPATARKASKEKTE